MDICPLSPISLGLKAVLEGDPELVPVCCLSTASEKAGQRGVSPTDPRTLAPAGPTAHDEGYTSATFIFIRSSIFSSSFS